MILNQSLWKNGPFKFDVSFLKAFWFHAQLISKDKLLKEAMAHSSAKSFTHGKCNGLSAVGGCWFGWEFSILRGLIRYRSVYTQRSSPNIIQHVALFMKLFMKTCPNRPPACCPVPPLWTVELPSREYFVVHLKRRKSFCFYFSLFVCGNSLSVHWW